MRAIAGWKAVVEGKILYIGCRRFTRSYVRRLLSSKKGEKKFYPGDDFRYTVKRGRILRHCIEGCCRDRYYKVPKWVKTWARRKT